MKIEGADKTDIREEIATPLLSALGYQRGTSNDISREPSLTYERQLGRKKLQILRYVDALTTSLSVMGAGRGQWRSRDRMNRLTFMP